MFPLGHVGITIGLIYYLQIKNYSGKDIDYRFIILLAMIPDIIDKTVGLVIFKDTIDNGRLVAHTPLFCLIVTTAAFHFRPGTWKLYSIPLWTHLMLDRIFEDPFLVFWPLLGWRFDSIDWEFGSWLDTLLHDPYTISGELIGGTILFLLFFHCRLYRKERFLELIHSGRIR